MKNIFDPGYRHNPVIPVLGILPLLVVVDSIQTAVAAGVASLLALVFVSVITSTIRNLLPVEIRLTAILLVAASVVSLIYLLLQFCLYEASEKLDIYIPLIAMNCMILAWADEYALRNGVIKTLLHTFQAGLGVLAVLIVIGITREYAVLSLLKQPAGAFLVFGFLVALYNFADNTKRLT